MDRRDGSFVDRLGERRSMQSVQPRGSAGSFLVNETVGAMGVELHDPIPHDLQRHAADLGCLCAGHPIIDVATATFRLLYALIVLGHDRRRIIHFEVTQNPTQVWLSRQITEAFPWDTAPRYLLRDRDASYGPAFRDRLRVMGIKEVVTAPRSPWQNPYVERLIGSIRRECLDHIIIFNEHHLRGVLSKYFHYHHTIRTHLSLNKDCPRPNGFSFAPEFRRNVRRLRALHHNGPVPETQNRGLRRAKALCVSVALLAEERGLDFLSEVRRGIGHWYAEHHARDRDTLGPDAAGEITLKPR